MEWNGSVSFEIKKLNKNVSVNLDWTKILTDEASITAIKYKELNATINGYEVFDYYGKYISYRLSEGFTNITHSNLEEIYFVTWKEIAQVGFL